MKTSSTILACSLLSYALANPALKRAACNADNCARAVTGTALGTASRSAHFADCQSFLGCTVTPATATVTSTVTAAAQTTGAAAVTSAVVAKRADGGAVTNCPSAVPAYASACTRPSAFSSACSCFGAAGSTSTLSTPTTTVTVTSTPTPPAQQCTSFDEVLDGPDQPVTYKQYFAGTGKTENPNNPGNQFGSPITSNYDGSLSKCDAAANCARFAAFANYFSFDLHFLKNTNKWECVMYFDSNTNGGYFNKNNANVGEVYGYSV